MKKRKSAAFAATALALFIIFAIIFVLGYGFSSVKGTPALTADKRRLQFRDGEFVILQMTDFHQWMGVEQSGLSVDMKDTLEPLLVKYISTALEQVKPDLVVLTGDNIFSLSWFYDTFESISLKTYKKIAAIFEERKQYWTLTFGNHDSESSFSKTDFMNVLIEYEYFIGGFESSNAFCAATFPDGDENRIGNVAIPIYDGEAIRYAVYTLDSGSNPSVVKDAPYRYILPEQTRWYLETEEFFNNTNDRVPVPGIMFTHIPLIEMEEAYYQRNEAIGYYCGISPAEVRSDIFEAAFAGEIKGFFFGHNHNNSCTTFYVRDGKKMMMGVTPQATAGGYDSEKSLMMSRVIKLSSDGNFLTYIHTSAQTDEYGYVDGGEVMYFNK